MGMFDGLARLMGGRPDRGLDLTRLTESWGLGDPSDDAVEAGPMSSHPDDPVAYDRDQWARRLKRVLADLPDSKGEWTALIADGRALGLDPAWIDRHQREEFDLIVRQVVSDGVFTEAEHRKLDLARDLIGLPDAEAEAIVHAIVAEAEAFFGRPIEGS